jgi:hypothetical protein
MIRRVLPGIRPSIVIPFGDQATLHEVAERFDVEWVVLDINHPAPLAGVYADPQSVPWLALRGQIEGPQGMPVYLLQRVAEDGSALP